MEYSTWLPMFVGFYNTNYINDEEILWYLFDSPYSVPDEIKEWIDNEVYQYIDYSKLYEETAKVICNAIGEFMVNEELIQSFEFETLVSPREYNFVNDSINIKVECDVQKLIDFIKNNFWEEFKEEIEKTYTSRDGFISYYENDAEEWLTTFKEDSDHKLGHLLEFVIAVGGEFKEDLLYEKTGEEIFISCFINYEELVKDLNEEFNLNIKELRELEED